jgi:hypothetical protein
MYACTISIGEHITNVLLGCKLRRDALCPSNALRIDSTPKNPRARVRICSADQCLQD